MSDDDVRDLAQHAGIELTWEDYAGRQQTVSLESTRNMLQSLGLPYLTKTDLVEARNLLASAGRPHLITAEVGKAVDLPITASPNCALAQLIQEDGTSIDLEINQSTHKVHLPPITIAGYHRLELGDHSLTLAVAPHRCFSIADMAPQSRLAGLAAQVYGLRHKHDCGIGDMAGVAALAKAAAPSGIDALALSPTHALFSANPAHYSPYSPSSRLFYNPLLADPVAIFGEARVARAQTAAALGVDARVRHEASLIDWPASSRDKLAILRCLFEDFLSNAAVPDHSRTLLEDFQSYRAAQGSLLERHALFEALQESRLQADPSAWHWHSWPHEWRDPDSDSVRKFTRKNEREILFHTFLQWLADRSYGSTQLTAKKAGMQIGLISDLAVGMSGGGSHAWTNQADILNGVEIGAPPDLFNPAGQNWGLTTFSPTALARNGFEPFIMTLRACMRHAGGVRIDHVMGLMHLWLVPTGAKPSEGAYLTFPLTDLLRLTALESWRHRAIVIGEDLGTVPPGFREQLHDSGIYGMRVLWFERDRHAFAPPKTWPTDVVAMTSTHDLPTVAGWWHGSDLETRGRISAVSKNEKSDRTKDRIELWDAFCTAQVADGSLPPDNDVQSVTDSAVSFIAETPARLALLPLEDALASTKQPNLPGTIDEHPNWRRRYSSDAEKLLGDSRVRKRIESLAARGRE